MSDQSLTLTKEERECLVQILDRALKDARVEEHRTRTPSYREFVLQQEELLISLLKKLGHAPG